MDFSNIGASEFERFGVFVSRCETAALRQMSHLAKSLEAIKELAEKGMAPG
jgi:hypothetical protein